MDRADCVRAYYRSLDEHDYDRLEAVLAPDVVHDRPDRTIEGRDSLVGFMRDGRPDTETTHAVSAVYTREDETEVAARGRLLDAAGDPLFEFVDVFAFDGEAIAAIDTFTR